MMRKFKSPITSSIPASSQAMSPCTLRHMACIGQESAAPLINVSSGLGFVPMAMMPVYCASKSGLHAFSLAMRVQLARLGFKVFEIVPPMVDTALNPAGRAKRASPRSRLVRPPH